VSKVYQPIFELKDKLKLWLLLLNFQFLTLFLF
jgi:hypothetical protein